MNIVELQSKEINTITGGNFTEFALSTVTQAMSLFVGIVALRAIEEHKKVEPPISSEGDTVTMTTGRAKAGLLLAKLGLDAGKAAIIQGGRMIAFYTVGEGGLLGWYYGKE